MDDREHILNNLSGSNPKKEYTIPGFHSSVNINKKIKDFIENIHRAGGHASLKEEKYLSSTIRELIKGSRALFFGPSEFFDQMPQGVHKSDLVKYDELDICILNGKAGVAENGSVWIDDTQLIDRRLPFISHHLVILLNRKHIVYDLSELYESIKPENTNFGILISGPSKTADIEQSLVMGAQGAVKHTVLIF